MEKFLRPQCLQGRAVLQLMGHPFRFIAECTVAETNKEDTCYSDAAAAGLNYPFE